AGREKYLLFAVVGPVVKKDTVYFQFRPKLAQQSVLNGGVVGDGRAEAADVAHGHGDSQRALRIESAPTFPEGDGGRDDGVLRTIFVGDGRNRPAEESGDDVVARLLVAGEETVLQKE